MLTTEDKILIEQRISNEKPSAGVAYLLAIFLGVLGAHRFYLGKTGTGVVMLLISLTFFGLAITYIWVLIDLFLIPGMIREKVDLLRRDLTLSAAAAAA
jgi:TM2 domain-containing membrane protein YozV